MNLFKGRQVRSDIILLSLRWYTKYPLSYRNLEEMLEGTVAKRKSGIKNRRKIP